MAARKDTAQNDKPELFVVDGSNIATEGRSKPSLEQLTEAVAAFREEHPDVSVTVVVDATFGHRIAKKEVKAFDKAVASNELVTPPAGAVGRGDAFILAIADKAQAGVFSNDSFQEFHGEYEWLFETGRLIGGKPVPHVGWVFVDRNPVRGRRSRESIKAAKQAVDADSSPTDEKEHAKRRVRKKKAAPHDEPSDETSSDKRSDTSSDKRSETKPSDDTSSDDTSSDETPSDSTATDRKQRRGRARRGGRKGGTATADQAARGDETADLAKAGTAKANEVNDPGTFFDFVEQHPVGSTVSGVVDSYSSHGAYARVGEALVYIPLRLMADPAPNSARKMVTLGDSVDVVVAAFVPERRSIDAALPAMAPAVTAPSDGDDPDDAAGATEPASEPKKRRGSRRGSKRAADDGAGRAAEADTPVKRAAAKKKAAKKQAAKKQAAKKQAVKKSAATNSAAKKQAANKPAKKQAAKQAAKKRAAKQSAAKKQAAKKPAKKQAAKKPAKKRAAKKSAANRSREAGSTS